LRAPSAGEDVARVFLALAVELFGILGGKERVLAELIAAQRAVRRSDDSIGVATLDDVEPAGRA
jgi:hypothetical protein